MAASALCRVFPSLVPQHGRRFRIESRQSEKVQDQMPRLASSFSGGGFLLVGARLLNLGGPGCLTTTPLLRAIRSSPVHGQDKVDSDRVYFPVNYVTFDTGHVFMAGFPR